MAYRFGQDEPVTEGVIRIAREQVEQAIDETTASALSVAERVHQVRKRCKKVRALLRLVRPALAGADTFRAENVSFRDTARTLSDLRDAHVRVETLDALLAAYDQAVPRERFEPLRLTLVRRREKLETDRRRLEARLAAFRDRMGGALRRVAAWHLADGGFGSVGGGLARTYKRGRTAMVAAYADPTPARFHEWRKRVKYSLYHHRLLCEAWPSVLGGRREAADRLADLLGLDHDLAVLRDGLVRRPPAGVQSDLVEVVSGLAQRRREALEKEAGPIGARLFAERPRDFVGRMEAYWNAWRTGTVLAS